MLQKPTFNKVNQRKTLADAVADDIRDRILSGDLKPGAALPTEVELAGQFGVSRIAVRDACRVLKAQGLVEIKHGTGMFVSQSQDAAFETALFLLLRRSGATTWDVHVFEQAILPEIAALAAAEATDEEIETLKSAIDDHLTLSQRIQSQWWDDTPPLDVLQPLIDSHLNVMRRLFAATHNAVFAHLAVPLTRLRSVREIVSSETMTPELLHKKEAEYYETFWKAVTSRKPDWARKKVRQAMALPEGVVEEMKQTLIGEVPRVEEGL